MIESINIESVTNDILARLVPGELIGASMAGLIVGSFVADETQDVAFLRVDAAGWSAVKRAAAKVAGVKPDRETTFVQYKAADSKTWQRLAKGRKVPAGAATRDATLRTYSGDALKRALTTLREFQGVSIDGETRGTDGVRVVRLARDIVS
jgi:hypothetical protein